MLASGYSRSFGSPQSRKSAFVSLFCHNFVFEELRPSYFFLDTASKTIAEGPLFCAWKIPFGRSEPHTFQITFILSLLTAFNSYTFVGMANKMKPSSEEALQFFRVLRNKRVQQSGEHWSLLDHAFQMHEVAFEKTCNWGILSEECHTRNDWKVGQLIMDMVLNF